MFTRVVLTDARARAKPCLRCGYSLRKIESLHCPECGLSAWLSLNGNDALDGSNPAWLSKLSLATALMALSHAAAIGILACWLVGVFHPRVFGLCFVFAGLGLLVYSAALLLACVHENRYPDRMKYRRWITRAAAGVGLLAALPLIWAGVEFGNHPNARALVWVLGMMPFLLIAIPSICTWWYLTPLAKRGFHPRLVRLCRIMMLSPLVPLVIFRFGGLLMVAAFIVPVVYILASAAMLIWFSILFRRAAKNASAAWAKETADPSVVQA